MVSISGSALTSSSRASSFSASRMSCFRSSVASSFRSLTSFWRTSSGISAGSSCTGRAASVSSFFFSSISILRTSYRIPAVGTGQNKKRRQQPASTLTRASTRTKPRPFSPLRSARTAPLTGQKRRTQPAPCPVLSHQNRIFDYDPGPLSCVHLLKIFSTFYYSAAQKAGQP